MCPIKDVASCHQFGTGNIIVHNVSGVYVSAFHLLRVFYSTYLHFFHIFSVY